MIASIALFIGVAFQTFFSKIINMLWELIDNYIWAQYSFDSVDGVEYIIENVLNNFTDFIHSKRIKPNKYDQDSIGFTYQWIFYKYVPIFIKYERYSTESGIKHVSLRLSTLVRYKHIIDELIEKARKHEKKNAVYIIDTNKRWTLIRHNNKLFDHLIIDDVIKNKLISEIGEFIRSEQKYIKDGAVWKKNYIFYGPPGTGKSSTIYAIANYFNLSVRIVNMMRTSVMKTYSLMNSVSSPALFIIEDLQSIVNKINNMKKRNNLDTHNKKNNEDNEDSEDSEDTYDHDDYMSFLLNLLDGSYTIHGSIIIITTNNIDSIDPIIIRPGRIDAKILFDKPNEKIIKGLCDKYNYKYGPADISKFVGKTHAELIELIQTKKDIC